MTLDNHETWRKTTLKECLADGTCKMYDDGAAWCRHYGMEMRWCDYQNCPKRQYYKTDGKLEIKQVDGVTWLQTECISIHLSDDQVRFLHSALAEVVANLDTKK